MGKGRAVEGSAIGGRVDIRGEGKRERKGYIEIRTPSIKLEMRNNKTERRGRERAGRKQINRGM